MARHHLAVSEAKLRFSDVVDRARRRGRTILTRHGRAVAAVIPLEDLAQLEAFERSESGRGLAGLLGKIEPADDLVDDALAVRRRRREERPRPPPDLDE